MYIGRLGSMPDKVFEMQNKHHLIRFNKPFKEKYEVSQHHRSEENPCREKSMVGVLCFDWCQVGGIVYGRFWRCLLGDHLLNLWLFLCHRSVTVCPKDHQEKKRKSLKTDPAPERCTKLKVSQSGIGCPPKSGPISMRKTEVDYGP